MKFFQKGMWRRKIGMFVMDLSLITLSIYLSMELRFEMSVPAAHANTMQQSIPLVLAIYMLCDAIGGIYNIMWRYAGVRDVSRLTMLSGIACGLTLAANQFMALGLFRGVLILIAMLGTITVGGSRVLYRLLSKDRIPGGLGDAMPVMIVGAGEAGAYAVNILWRPWHG